MTDEWRSYPGIGAEFAGGHEIVTHSAGEYARGDVHTDTAESFFALLKRGVIGSFHHISKQAPGSLLRRVLFPLGPSVDKRQRADPDRHQPKGAGCHTDGLPAPKPPNSSPGGALHSLDPLVARSPSRALHALQIRRSRRETSDGAVDGASFPAHNAEMDAAAVIRAEIERRKQRVDEARHVVDDA